jgi:hypothetical protein
MEFAANHRKPFPVNCHMGHVRLEVSEMEVSEWESSTSKKNNDVILLINHPPTSSTKSQVVIA